MKQLDDIERSLQSLDNALSYVGCRDVSSASDRVQELAVLVLDLVTALKEILNGQSPRDDA